MIRDYLRVEEAITFIKAFGFEKEWSQPYLTSEDKVFKKIKQVANNDSYFGLMVYDDETIIGVFGFLKDEENRYLEMSFTYTQKEQAYEELVSYLKEHYRGYECDFVFNPQNKLCLDFLNKKEARTQKAQHLMRAKAKQYIYTNGCEFSEKYRQQYLALHTKEGFWSGERVLADEYFKVYLATDHDELVGYIDVCGNFVYDLFIREDKRHLGYGTILLNKALNEAENNLELTVNIDNEIALGLYQKLGFEVVEGCDSQMAVLRVED